MIDIDALKTIMDEKLWQIEEMIKALDNINYCKVEFLSFIGPASDTFKDAENKLGNIFYSQTFRELDENYIVLALFLRETSYWFADGIVGMAKYTNCPPNISNGYTMYIDYCFYRTEKQEIRRYKTIEELRENLFEQYKYNRNVKYNNKNNIKILKLLTLIDEYEQVINENKRLRTDTPLPQDYYFNDVN